VLHEVARVRDWLMFQSKPLRERRQALREKSFCALLRDD